MGWLTTAGVVGGTFLGGPAGAAVGGALGGAIEGRKEQKEIDRYNAGQAEAGKYSSYTNQQPRYNYKKTGAMDQALGGAAQGLMFSQGGIGGKMAGSGQSWLGSMGMGAGANAGTAGVMQGGMQDQTKQLAMQQEMAPKSWLNPQMTMDY